MESRWNSADRTGGLVLQQRMQAFRRHVLQRFGVEGMELTAENTENTKTKEATSGFLFALFAFSAVNGWFSSV